MKHSEVQRDYSRLSRAQLERELDNAMNGWFAAICEGIALTQCLQEINRATEAARTVLGKRVREIERNEHPTDR